MTSARIGIPTNVVVGGSVDLLLVQTDGAYPEGNVTFAFNEEPRAITGVQKVAQLFMKVLLTSQGSDVLNPKMGTGLSPLVIGANVQSSPSDFTAQVRTEINRATTQVKSMSTANNSDPASQLASTQILGINASADSMTVFLQLTTNAGVTASIAVPFPQLNLNV